MLRNFASIVVGLCLSATGVLAQTGWTPQDGVDTLPRGSDQTEHVNMLSWQFHPITDGTQVTAFFATITGDDAWGGNVKLMYFSHDSAGVWTSYGWAEDGTDGAISWIRSTHGSNSLAQSDFASYPAGASPVAPEEMKNGFFLSDPNASILDELDEGQAEVVIQWLAEAGYKVAPKLSEALGVAGQVVLNESMSYMTNQVEYTLFPLKTTYMAAPTRRWCSCFVTTSTVTPSAPGPATLVPPTPTTPNPVPAIGACDYTFERTISTTTVRRVGDYVVVCVDCTGMTVTTVKQHVTIRVLAPCTVPTPTNADPWS